MREHRGSLLEREIKEDFSEEEANIYLDTCQMRRRSREEARAEARGRLWGLRGERRQEAEDHAGLQGRGKSWVSLCVLGDDVNW